jgi:hypothetical protein
VSVAVARARAALAADAGTLIAALLAYDPERAWPRSRFSPHF